MKTIKQINMDDTNYRINNFMIKLQCEADRQSYINAGEQDRLMQQFMKENPLLTDDQIVEQFDDYVSRKGK